MFLEVESPGAVICGALEELGVRELEPAVGEQQGLAADVAVGSARPPQLQQSLRSIGPTDDTEFARDSSSDSSKCRSSEARSRMSASSVRSKCSTNIEMKFAIPQICSG